jgi:hypothetical protein
LQHRLCHGSQKISFTSLLQQLGQHQSLFGHRVPLALQVEVSQLHLSPPARWPPQLRRRTYTADCSEIPPPSWTLTRKLPRSERLPLAFAY